MKSMIANLLLNNTVYSPCLNRRGPKIYINKFCSSIRVCIGIAIGKASSLDRFNSACTIKTLNN